MATVTGFVNIYRSGYFHRRDKPGALNLHPGDIYPTFEAAQKDIAPGVGYVCTGTVSYDDTDCQMRPNAAYSVPTPLGVTRQMVDQGTADWLVG